MILVYFFSRAVVGAALFHAQNLHFSAFSTDLLTYLYTDLSTKIVYIV